MKCVTFESAWLWRGTEYQAGTTYLMDNSTAAGHMALGAEVSEIRNPHPGELPPGYDAKADIPNRRILLYRQGGIGDLLFFTPSIRRLRELHPDAAIDVCCHAPYAIVFDQNPNVSDCPAYPMPLEQVKTYDHAVFFEDVIETNPDAETMHAVDLMAKRIGVELSNRDMEYTLQEPDFRAALTRFPRTPERPRIAIQVYASTPVRSWPEQHIANFVQACLMLGWEVFLFGSPGSVHSAGAARLLTNLTQLESPPELRESIAIMGTCDVLVAPDSSLIHIAGALGIPAVGLYGPFPWKLRTAYAPTTKSLTGVGFCSPCFHHTKGEHIFPTDGPCQKSGICNVLGTITPERVMTATKQQLRKAWYLQGASKN